MTRRRLPPRSGGFYSQKRNRGKLAIQDTDQSCCMILGGEPISFPFRVWNIGERTFKDVNYCEKFLWPKETSSNLTLFLSKCLERVFPKLMAYSFLQLHLLPNQNRGLYQVLDTGTARWRGNVLMVKTPEGRRSLTPIPTNPGESRASMVISHTTLHARTRHHLLTENGTSTKRGSHLPLGL